MSQVRAAIPGAGVEGLAEAVARGFVHVELEAREDRPAAHLEALADAGVFVASVRFSGALHVADVGARRAALARLRRQLDDAARLGAFVAHLDAGPCREGDGLAYFTDGCGLLAEHAEGCLVELTVGGLPEALRWPAEGGPLVGVTVEGDDIETARRAGGQLSYIRRPGKVMQDALTTLRYKGFVAVDLHSPHTSSSTSSAT